MARFSMMILWHY